MGAKRKLGIMSVAAIIWLVLLCGCFGLQLGVGDRPGRVPAESLTEFEAAIAPYVRKAKDTLPQVKKRYQAGLPEGDVLYVTVRLYDSAGKFEQVFVRVVDWYGDDIIGRVSRSPEMMAGVTPQETLSFKEEAILDWVITKSDGLEEGNYVGRFLAGYKK